MNRQDENHNKFGALTEKEMLTPLTMAVVRAGSEAARNMRGGGLRQPTKAKEKPPTSTDLYDGLATLYNDAELGALVVVNLPNRPTRQNLRKVLLGRGLTYDVDYTLFRAVRDSFGAPYPASQRPLVMEKLSKRECKVAPHRVAKARRLAGEAVERGSADPRLLYAPKRGLPKTLVETKSKKKLADLPKVPFPLHYTEKPVPDVPAYREMDVAADPLDAEADQELRNAILPDLDIE